MLLCVYFLLTGATLERVLFSLYNVMPLDGTERLILAVLLAQGLQSQTQQDSQNDQSANHEEPSEPVEKSGVDPMIVVGALVVLAVLLGLALKTLRKKNGKG